MDFNQLNHRTQELRKYCVEIPLWQSIITIAIFKLVFSAICLTTFLYLSISCDGKGDLELLNSLNETSLHLDTNLNYFQEFNVAVQKRAAKIIYATYVILSVQFIISFGLSIVLLVGAVKSNILLMKIWCALTIVEIVLDIILVIVVFAIGGSSAFGILVGSCLLSILFLAFVKNFMNEIEKEPATKSVTAPNNQET